MVNLVVYELAGRPYRARSANSINNWKCALSTCITISLKNNFTNHFGAQKSSDLPPVHSGLVLTRGVTNYLFGHGFKRIDGRLIAAVPGISRDVFKSDLKIHIGLIR